LETKKQANIAPPESCALGGSLVGLVQGSQIRTISAARDAISNNSHLSYLVYSPAFRSALTASEQVPFKNQGSEGHK